MSNLAKLSVDEGQPPQRLALVRRRRPRSRTRYYAFLSYSHKDEELADWLHRELERFRVPPSLVGRLTTNGVLPKRLTPIFRDQQELPAADDLGEEIEAALASSQFLIVLCSPNAASSRWTNAEVERFKRVRPDGCVLAAIASGEPFASEMPGREAEECFPPALRFKFDRRGRATAKRAEPLAADLRAQGDGRRLGFLKLVAGMLGIGLDELVQRDTTERHRRMAWFAAASLGGMAVTSGLALTAIQARDAARDERREAEGMVAFMVGDLKDKLEPIGRLDALDGVGSRVLAYYSKQKASELTDAALLQRSRALSLTAQVAYLRGDLKTAARLYNEAAAGTGEAVGRAPDDAKRLYDHAQNIFWVGDLARRRGDIGQAEAAYREYQRLAGEMVESEPNNLKWRMEAQYARENLGIVLMSQRRFGEAAQQFSSALRPMESLASLDADNAEYQTELTNLLGWLADSYRALGRFGDAIALRQRQVALLDKQIAGGASNVGVRQQLIPAFRALGGLFTSRGETEQGIAYHRRALTEANRLIPVEPANSLWRDLAAGVHLDLARSLLALGRRDEAAGEAASGCAAADALRARDPNVINWRMLQTNCLDMRARLALASGAQSTALAFAQRTVAAARSERSGDPVNDRYRIAAAFRLLGDVHQRMAQGDAASGAWTAALAQLPAKVSERPWEMRERAELLRRVGRTQEAQPLADRLAKIGYRGVT